MPETPVPPEAVEAAADAMGRSWTSGSGHAALSRPRLEQLATAALEAAAPAITAQALEDQKRRLLARPDCGPADDHERALYWQRIASEALFRLNELEDLAGDVAAIRADERERIAAEIPAVLDEATEAVTDMIMEAVKAERERIRSRPVIQRLELHEAVWRCAGCSAPLIESEITHMPRCGEMGGGSR